jgi:hypothetical protein
MKGIRRKGSIIVALLTAPLITKINPACKTENCHTPWLWAGALSLRIAIVQNLRGLRK